MIEGEVNNACEAVVALSLQGPEGQAQDFEAVIDTGYSGFLTLPNALVAELGLKDCSSTLLALPSTSESKRLLTGVTGG